MPRPVARRATCRASTITAINHAAMLQARECVRGGCTETATAAPASAMPTSSPVSRQVRTSALRRRSACIAETRRTPAVGLPRGAGAWPAIGAQGAAAGAGDCVPVGDCRAHLATRSRSAGNSASHSGVAGATTRATTSEGRPARRRSATAREAAAHSASATRAPQPPKGGAAPSRCARPAWGGPGPPRDAPAPCCTRSGTAPGRS